jgi:uncharacterized protein YbbK (DUF523 family)
MTCLPAPPEPPYRVGISRCLLGDRVRYDGTGAHSSLPHDALQGILEYRGICPEVAIGMTIPRPAIRLVGTAQNYRVIGVDDPGLDKTDELVAYANSQAPGIADLAGYIFMHHSPSCGLAEVKVHARNTSTVQRPSTVQRKGTGVYAATIVAALPDLPVEDGIRLFDEKIREGFLLRVAVYAHWRALRSTLTGAELVAFHQLHAERFKQHSTSAFAAAEQLLTDLESDLAATADAYITQLMNSLKLSTD